MSDTTWGALSKFKPSRIYNTPARPNFSESVLSDPKRDKRRELVDLLNIVSGLPGADIALAKGLSGLGAGFAQGGLVKMARGGDPSVESVDIGYDPREIVRMLFSDKEDAGPERPNDWRQWQSSPAYRASIGAVMSPEGSQMGNAGTFDVTIPLSDRDAVTLQGMMQAIMEERAKGVAGGGRLGYRYDLTPLESIQPYIEGGGHYVRTPQGASKGFGVTGGGINYNKRF